MHENVHMATQQNSSGDRYTNDMYVHMVETKDIHRRELPNNTKETYIKQSGETKQVEVNARIDTGAMSNFLPLKVFRKLQAVQLE